MKLKLGELIAILAIIAVLGGVALGPITNGIKKAKGSAELQKAHAQALADYQAQVDAGVPNPVMKSVKALPDGTIVAYTDADDQDRIKVSSGNLVSTGRRMVVNSGTVTIPWPKMPAALLWTPGVRMLHPRRLPYFRRPCYESGKNSARAVPMDQGFAYNEPATTTTQMQGGTIRGSGFLPPAGPTGTPSEVKLAENAKGSPSAGRKHRTSRTQTRESIHRLDENWKKPANLPADTTAPAADSRKLIRNAQLDLEVKSFQAAFDQVSALTKAAGGYVDTSNSQKGGNGKLQGTIVVKVLPENLDGFLLKLRDLGEVKNQSVSTDDVTKEYFDTQARLVNSQKMEVQLQDLLKRENSKVSDLLAVERELGRVRGDIEQMQGQLKLYDFQVQYATVTMQIAEKDLRQAAAYLLKEQDNFALFATDVEGTFQKARAAADNFKAQVLTANLQHNSGSDVSAELDVMVAPDQIEPFLAQVRGLGRVANFTRQTQRIAQDGGDSAQPADQTLTEKDKVSVQLAIRSDDDSRKQVALTVVAKAVDEALDQAKAAALANAGVEILSSSLNKTPQGQSTAEISVRVPGKEYDALIAAFRALGREASLSIQRNDSSGAGDDDAPVIVQLSLTDNDQPVQATRPVDRRRRRRLRRRSRSSRMPGPPAWK